MKKIFILFLAIIILCFYGCTAVNYTFTQDGKTLGKGIGQVQLGVSAGSMYWEADSFDVVELKNDETKLSPLLNLSVQGGIHDRIDIGGGMSVGLISINLRFFPKFSLFSNEKKYGISYMPVAGITWMPDTLLGLSNEGLKAHTWSLYHTFPMNIDVNDKMVLTAQALAGKEESSVTLLLGNDQGKIYKFIREVKGFSLGLRYRIKERSSIHPEISFISYDSGKPIIVYGISGIIALGENKLSKLKEVNW